MDKDQNQLRHFKTRTQSAVNSNLWNNCSPIFPKATQHISDVYEIDWDNPNNQIDSIRFRYIGTSPLQSSYVGSCLRRLEFGCAKSTDQQRC